MRRLLITALIGFGLCFPAHAAGDDPLGAIGESFVRGLVHERDVALVFDYLREALDAAADGRDPPAADRILERGEAIGVEAKRRGVVAGRAVLDAIEQSVRDLFRDRRLAPPLPQQRL